MSCPKCEEYRSEGKTHCWECNFDLLPETAQPAESGSLQAAGSQTLRQRVEKAEAEALSWMINARTACDRSLQLAIGKTGTALVELLVLLDAREKESWNGGTHGQTTHKPS
jgi:hypothetical protein